MFNVKRIDKKTNKFYVEVDDKEIEFNALDFNKYFYPAYCITIHSSQGSTFETEYGIYDWNMLDSTLKYVALTRATNINNIYVNI
jgi:ATP-dependent exoDNAse (exonuclease V) alpha subunit